MIVAIAKKLRLKAAGLALLSLFLLPAQADAACSVFYRVAAGDTLRTISLRETGTDDYDRLFRANTDILSDPSRIEIGQLLYIPCNAGAFVDRSSAMAAAGRKPTFRDNLGTRRAGARADVPVAGPSVAEVAKSAVPLTEPPAALRVLTGSGLAPLSHRDLPGHGMANLLLSEALAAVKDTRTLELAVVDDWKSHLSVLMPTGAFNLALPWPRPDCGAAVPTQLSQKLCASFVYSAPLYEIQMTTVALAGDPLEQARSANALAGRTVCRPAGFPAVDLEKTNKALKQEMTIVTRFTAEDCAAMMVEGRADAVSLPEVDAIRLLQSADFSGQLIRARYLGASVPVHALALRSAPGSEALIAKVNAGLAQLQTSGRWMEVISTYLRDLPEAAKSQ